MLLHTKKFVLCLLPKCMIGLDISLATSYWIPVNTEGLFVSVWYYDCVCWQSEVTMLKNEVTQLKQLLLTHKDCPITTMQKESQGYLSEYYHAPTWPGVTLHYNRFILFVGHTHWYRYLWHFWNVWRLSLPGYRGKHTHFLSQWTTCCGVYNAGNRYIVSIFTLKYSKCLQVMCPACLSQLPNSLIIH